jgi:RimJ/RimL family protein N-acetyltransferase
MKDNWNVKVIGKKVVLVPYKEKFVPKYHGFMSDPAMLELTASEPLTLEEEYEMQKTWYNDPKKLTFIILSKDMSTSDEEREAREVGCMAGDINLFLHDNDDPYNAEVDVMIGEPCYRNKGLATEALNLIMHFGIHKLQIKRFFAKISETNDPSIRLFERMGFERINYSAAWKEIEYEFVTNYNDDEDDDCKKRNAQKNRDTIERNVSNAVWTTYD